MYIDYDFELVLGWGNVMFEIHLGIIKMALYAKHLLAGQDKHCNYAQPCSTNTASIAPLCKDRCCTQMQPLAIGDCKGAHCWPVTVASNGGGGVSVHPNLSVSYGNRFCAGKGDWAAKNPTAKGRKQSPWICTAMQGNQCGPRLQGQRPRQPVPQSDT